MFNYILLITDSKGETVTKFELDIGESKKGTYATISGKQDNAVIPFGKLYVDESKVTNGAGKKAKKAS